MKGSHKKAPNEPKQDTANNKEDLLKEIQNSQFDQFVRSNIEIRQIKIHNPMKISFPLQNNAHSNYIQVIDNYFNSLSQYEYPNFLPSFYQRMLSLSEYPNRNEIVEYINKKINILTDQSVNELLSQITLSCFYEKLEKIQISLQNLNIIFGKLCGNVKEIIITNIRSHFNHENIRKFRDLIQSIINEFSQDENSETVLLIIHFFTQFDLLTKEIKDHFSSTFINTMSSIAKKSKKTPFESTAKLFCKLCQIFPIGETSILERIVKPYLKNILKMDLQSFVGSLMSDIHNYFKDIYNFVYCTNEVNSLINYFISYFSNSAKKMNFDEVLINFQMFKNFSTEIKIKIAQAIRKCLPRNDEFVAIRYADIIDKTFRKEVTNTKFQESYDNLDEMYLIQNRDVFENSHFSRMLQRSLEISMVPDQNFIQNYKLHFGDYSVIRFESLLNDYKESAKLADEFNSTNKVPPFLNIYVFYSVNWSRKYRVLSIMPDIVKKYLERFTKFYKAKNPRRFIEWCPLLSNCILEINNITIKCNGIAASVLYLLCNGPKTSKEISEEMFYDVDEVEVILNTLKSSNFGHFLLMKNDIYSINEKAKITDNTIELSSRLPQDSKTEIKKEKVAIMTSRGRQIEAAILLCLKGESPVKENDLFKKAEARLKFNLDLFLFEEKLKSLAIKRFIKRDLEEKTVTYIP